jgi:transcriptional regulator with XRE-family HTH domain
VNGWDRVTAAVIDRRSELGWTQRRLADEAGVAERTIQNLEAGKVPQPLKRAQIEKALGWEPGEFRRIAGREPEADVVPPGLRQAVRDILPPDRAKVVEAAIEAALRAEVPARGPSGPREGRAAAS